MTKSEAAKLLTLIATFDGRTVDEAGAAVWAEALKGLDFQRCWDAVIAHHRKSDKWIKPAHIWEMARTTTDGDAAVNPLEILPDCEQGRWCRTCKGVHQPDEACHVLEARPAMHKQLVSTFRTAAIEAAEVVERPAAEPTVSDVQARAIEDQRARQLAALQAMSEEAS